METICCSHFPLYRDLPLYEFHQIGRATTGVVSLLSWSRRGLVNYIRWCIQNLFSAAIELVCGSSPIASLDQPCTSESEHKCTGMDEMNKKNLEAAGFHWADLFTL